MDSCYVLTDFSSFPLFVCPWQTLRGGHVAFREYIQCGKGRDVGLQQLFKFEAKLAQGTQLYSSIHGPISESFRMAGAAMQCLTRDVYRLAFGLDFFRLLSFFYGGRILSCSS